MLGKAAIFWHCQVQFSFGKGQAQMDGNLQQVQGSKPSSLGFMKMEGRKIKIKSQSLLHSRVSKRLSRICCQGNKFTVVLFDILVATR